MARQRGIRQRKNKPPGKWSDEATRDFFERHDGDVDSMKVTISDWEYITDPGGFAAAIKDYCLQTTFWRGPKGKEGNA